MNNIIIDELKTKTWSEILDIFSDTSAFKLISDEEGLVIKIKPMINTNGTEDNSDCDLIILLKPDVVDSFVSVFTIIEFLSNGYKNYLSFLHGEPNFADFKLLPDGKFKNYDDKDILDFDTLYEKLSKIKMWKNLSLKVDVTNIPPFNSLYRVSSDKDIVAFSNKGNCAYNAQYLAYDETNGECGFYCHNGNFICTLKEYASKFVFENYIHLGTIDIYLHQDSFLVKRNMPHKTKQIFKIAYSKEGYSTLFDILNTFNQIEKLTNDFIIICRASEALIK